jgi:hypothetical protein
MDRSPQPVRKCPLCNEDWPKLTTHVCEVEVTLPEPQYLSALLFDLIRDCPVMLGGTDLSASIAAELAMPLAKVLTARSVDMYTAMTTDLEASEQ